MEQGNAVGLTEMIRREAQQTVWDAYEEAKANYVEAKPANPSIDFVVPEPPPVLVSRHPGAIYYTPEILSPSDRAAKALETLEAWKSAQVELANAAAQFVSHWHDLLMHQYKGAEDVAESLAGLKERADHMASTEAAFLKAIQGR